MQENKAGPDKVVALRQRAEKVLQRQPEELQEMLPEDIQHLIHELRVHQIELEMQNEELRRTQEALEASRARYFDLYDLAPVGYVTLSEQGLIREANLTAVTLLGVARGALVKQPLTRFILPEDQDIYYRHRKRLFERGEPQVCELRMVRVDGSPFWVRVEATVAQDAQRGAPVCRAVVSDITECKRAEEALRESEERFRIAAESASDLIWEWDILNGKLEWFGAIDALLGYAPGEFPRTLEAWERIIHPDDHDRVMATLDQHLKTRAPYIEEYGVRRKDGTFGHWIGKGEALWDERGNACKMIGVCTDITVRKQAEEALKEHSEQLEELVEERTQELREAQERLIRQEKLAVLGQLAGGVGHELRTPLGAIKNAAYFLHMVLQDPDVETREILEILDKEVGTAEKIISSLLDFARTRPPTRRKVDLNDVVQEELSRTPLPDAPRVEVVCQLDEDLPFILADPDQLSQVFGNIIHNGIQAMTDGGRLVVRSAVESPEWVTVSVADTGAGISEENLKKIFEPLFTTKAKGIGLGLALVKTLVEGHGGTVGVESQVGEGSTFTVRLPLDANAAEGQGV
jgi:PAS domain S-box-containing protein